MKKAFFEKKGFGVFCILFGLLGLLILAHHIVSYDNILRPNLAYLMENKIITNDRGGTTFLFMFTNLSNIFVDVFLILFGIGLFGSEKLYKLTHNDVIKGAITLYICITGIIYCCVLMPFQKASSFPLFPYPMEGGMWLSNIVNVWCHVLTPVLFTAFWFFPMENKTLPKFKTSMKYLIFPLVYFIFSIIRGGVVDWYPYPFLSSRQLWETLFKNKAYDTVPALLLFAVVFVVLCGIFVAVGIGLNAIHNAKVRKLNGTEKNKEEAKSLS